MISIFCRPQDVGRMQDLEDRGGVEENLTRPGMLLILTKDQQNRITKEEQRQACRDMLMKVRFSCE